MKNKFDKGYLTTQIHWKKTPSTPTHNTFLQKVMLLTDIVGKTLKATDIFYIVGIHQIIKLIILGSKKTSNIICL